MAKQKKLNLNNAKIVLERVAKDEFKDVDLLSLSHEFSEFSTDKKLYDYQSESLKNAFKVLFKFYNDFNGDKEKLYEIYKKYETPNLDKKLSENEILKPFYDDERGVISFANFINKMSFYMTMGSGKTIVIIKLIELLSKAMSENLIPKKNIMFFTANEHLLQKFKDEVELYNKSAKRQICVDSLKNYSSENSLFDEINVWAYRADLLSDDEKENKIDYANYLNNAKNYIILDEAHKGEKKTSQKENSKRQNIFNIMSKNGFLFNFSATFVSDENKVTAICDISFAKWQQMGYGKRMLNFNDLNGYKTNSEFNEFERQKALLKAITLLALSKKLKIKGAYHNPMMVAFANSVNTDESDAQILFNTIKSVANKNLDDVFSVAKAELYDDLKKARFLISDNESSDDILGFKELSDEVYNIANSEILELVFYAKSGNLEAIYFENVGEIAFKLDTADKPFLLVKFGDIMPWIKEKLSDIKITRSFENKEYFKNINENSINILLGSRTFYEGWDSTRPNVMLFLNIGSGDAQKFLVQSLGRGLRVQSVGGARKRLNYIAISDNEKEKYKKSALMLESLFIFSTTKEGVEAIVNAQKELSKSVSKKSEIALSKNERITGEKRLFIPVYKPFKVALNEIDKDSTIKMSSKNKDYLTSITKNMKNALIALKYGINDRSKIDEIRGLVGQNKFGTDEKMDHKNSQNLMDKIARNLKINSEKFSEFKKLGDEIVHFKHIGVDDEYKDELEAKIKSIRLKGENYKGVTIDPDFIYHYFTPVLHSENKFAWISHIIDDESETKFLEHIKGLALTLKKKYDWWFFSRNDESLDNIYVPYIKDAKGHKFHPDFIFWAQKGDTQKIVLLDPKGLVFSEWQHKIDGYKKIFDESKTYYKDGINLQIVCRVVNDTTDVPDEYKKWRIKFDEIASVF